MYKYDVNTRENSIVVGVFLRREHLEENEKKYFMDEMLNLIKADSMHVSGQIMKNANKIYSKYYVSEKTIEDIKRLSVEKNAKLVIFYNDITPAQKRNIEKYMDINVMDRTELIIDIFFKHAKTYEAKLQAELAKLEYEVSHLVKKWSHFGKIRGGKVTTRGKGETQLEVDRREYKRKIAIIKRKLKLREKNLIVQSKNRRSLFNISLIGYTNAGKSTLFNALTHSEVYIADQLFATLDTTNRRYYLGDKNIIISDTIGFISNLPPQLIVSFKTTLQDIAKSNLLLHIVDINDPFFDKHIQDVNKILSELNAEHVNNILVFNKIDKQTDQNLINSLKRIYPNALFISAKNKTNFEQLRNKIIKFINKEENNE